jgi:hypothetical protein
VKIAFIFIRMGNERLFNVCHYHLRFFIFPLYCNTCFIHIGECNKCELKTYNISIVLDIITLTKH